MMSPQLCTTTLTLLTILRLAAAGLIMPAPILPTPTRYLDGAIGPVLDRRGNVHTSICDGVGIFTCAADRKSSCYGGLDGYIGCCSASSCAPRTECYSSASNLALTAAAYSHNNLGYVVCSQSEYPNCATITNPAMNQYIMYCTDRAALVTSSYAASRLAISTGSTIFPTTDSSSSPSSTSISMSDSGTPSVSISTVTNIPTVIPLSPVTSASTHTSSSILIPAIIIPIFILVFSCLALASVCFYKRRGYIIPARFTHRHRPTAIPTNTDEKTISTPLPTGTTFVASPRQEDNHKGPADFMTGIYEADSRALTPPPAFTDPSGSPIQKREITSFYITNPDRPDHSRPTSTAVSSLHGFSPRIGTEGSPRSTVSAGVAHLGTERVVSELSVDRPSPTTPSHSRQASATDPLTHEGAGHRRGLSETHPSTSLLDQKTEAQNTTGTRYDPYKYHSPESGGLGLIPSDIYPLQRPVVGNQGDENTRAVPVYRHGATARENDNARDISHSSSTIGGGRERDPERGREKDGTGDRGWLSPEVAMRDGFRD